MADVARARGSTGLSVVSTFSGCGGSCLGFEMAGFEPVFASEFIEPARVVYAANHPGVPIDPRDVREVRAEEVLEAIGRERGDVDVLEGSPPCSSFSTAGNREKDWGRVKAYSGTKQRTDDLFFEFARLLEGIRPRAFVAENVSGLVKGQAYGYFVEILGRLRAAGYRVGAKVVDAQWLGVPQARSRLIFVGVREDLGIEPPFPKPLGRRVSLDEAIRDLRPTSTELEEAAIPAGSAIGREYRNVKVGASSDRYYMLQRAHPNRPCPTITVAAGGVTTAGVVHPHERRKFTIRELRRICSFPDDFALSGDFSQRWERLGRSVPPLMMRAIAGALRDRVFAPLGLVRDGWREAA